MRRRHRRSTLIINRIVRSPRSVIPLVGLITWYLGDLRARCQRGQVHTITRGRSNRAECLGFADEDLAICDNALNSGMVCAARLQPRQ